MIETVEPLGIAFAFPAHLGATMTAGIQEQADIVIAIPRQNNGTPSYIAGLEIARFGHFGFMTGINPAPVEDPVAFRYQDIRIDKSFPVEPEVVTAGIIDYVRVLLHTRRMPDFAEFVHSIDAIRLSGFGGPIS